MTEPQVSIQSGARLRVTLQTTGLQGASGIGLRFSSASTTRTLTEGDKGSLGEFTAASEVTIAVPTGLSDFWECSFLQLGTGQLTVSPAVGVTIVSVHDNRKTYGQYSTITLMRLTTADTFLLVGDLGS